MPFPRKEPPGRDPALDGLRGIAVSLVFLAHYGGGLRSHQPLLHAAGAFTEAGWVGVEVFFTLSGFLITRILLAREEGPLRFFYARRALRILPLYCFALLFCASAAVLRGAHVVQLRPLLLYLGFLQNIPGLFGTALHTPPPVPLYHLWSLAVEEQFYLLWPLALARCRTPSRKLMLCYGCFGLFWFLEAVVVRIHPGALPALAVSTPARAGGLLLGSALAIRRRNASISRLKVPRWIIGGTLILGLFMITGLRTGSFLPGSRAGLLVLVPLADLLSVVGLALALDAAPLRTFLGSQPLVWTGTVSYGFYVLHILLQPLFDRGAALLTGGHAGFLYQGVRLALALPLSLGAAWLSFRYLESPFLRLKHRFRRVPVALSR